MADDFEQLASYIINEYDYIFYVSPEGVELEDNGVRTIDANYRNEIDKEIQFLCKKYKYKSKRLYTLSGTTEERIEKIKQVMSL